jgi:hypothetical protein
MVGYAELGWPYAECRIMPRATRDVCPSAIEARVRESARFDLPGIILGVSPCDQPVAGRRSDETQTVEQRPSAESIEELLTAFDRHLQGQRGCTKGTRQHYRLESSRSIVVMQMPANRGPA